MIRIQQADYDAIRRHGEQTYPHECCGVLLGRDDGTQREVTSTVRCRNMRSDSPQNRYQIDPRELVGIQREARQRGEDIVGFYHSHPDHAPLWSQTDLAEAHWIGCSYMITSVEQGKALVSNSFVLEGEDEAGKRLVQEPIEVVAMPRIETGARV